MDAFYAAVEVLDHPELTGKEVIVGGTGRRGVVASCTYEARAYGVRSAMPAGQARRLCPHAVFLAGRFGRYAEVSSRLHAIFREYTPLVEGISLDEAFLDVSGAGRLFGSAPELAFALRRRVAVELALTCSVGVAPVKFLAKMASEAAKPRPSLRGVIPGAGVVVIEPGQELPFLHPMPIESLWGVGPVTATRLRRLGVTTVGELAAVPADVLEAAVGRAHGRHLGRLAHGIDDRPVEPARDIKSVSHEETYPVDRYEPRELADEIARLADSVASRMRKGGLVGRTVMLKVRFGDFVTRTRSRTTTDGLSDGPSIASIAMDLLAGVDVSPGVRLLGLAVSNLSAVKAEPAQQMRLDLDRVGRATGGPRGAWRRASGAVDAVRDRFGDDAVGPASLLGPQGVRVRRPGDTQWGPAGAAESRP
jgi:DNA polymerase-4